MILICRHCCSPTNSLILKNYFVLLTTHRLTSGISFLTHFVNHVLICLFLIHHSAMIISPHHCHQCRHHHSYHPSPHHSSLPTSKLLYFSSPSLYRHLTLFRTDFTDICTCLRTVQNVSYGSFVFF